jgi:hypothetical protein
LPTISIKAKDLAAEMTGLNVQTKDLKGQVPIENEHTDNNTAVRKMLLERGIRPEELPPAEDVKKVQRKLEKDEKKMLKDVKKGKDDKSLKKEYVKRFNHPDFPGGSFFYVFSQKLKIASNENSILL